MKIEIAEHSRMSERGSSLLRLIQNRDMPVLDLLVRESVQNSLDAAMPGTGCVNMGYEVREFNSAELNSHLEGITHSLNKKFPTGTYKFLEIKDSNTTGLTGPLHYKDVKDNQFGNLLKLIYEICMPQQQEGSGGSWGLGKTVYFRIGIGLVLYYTRIQEEVEDDEKNKGRHYASRLAACLVEDEGKSDAIINSEDGKPKRGIAWWGQCAGNNTTMPLTDHNDIKEVLKVFSTSLYKGAETGTTIIIPYIEENKLLEGTSLISKVVDMNINPWWNDSVHDYLKVAIQRWYAPRIMNRHYPNGRSLRAKVNGEVIFDDKILPLFRVIQALYNRTPLATELKDEYEVDILSDIESTVEKISLKGVLKNTGCAGYISYVKLTKKELLMLPPKNSYNPNIQISKNDGDMDGNLPIIMYVRKPGMIVGYETVGHWTEGIPKTSKDEFIIGLFILNSANMLSSPNDKMSLDEYIRKSEKADHTSWTDWNIGSLKPCIISKIQRQVRNDISKTYSKPIETPPRKNIGLGRVLAKFLLPPENFGNKASFNVPNNRRTSNSISSGFGLKIIGNPVYQDGKIKVDFELNCGKKSDKLEIQLQVLSETGGIFADKWEDDDVIGTPFPMKLEKIEIVKLKISKKIPIIQLKNFELYENKEINECNNISLKIVKTIKYNIPYAATIKLPEKNGYILFGSVYFSGNVDKIQGSLVVS